MNKELQDKAWSVLPKEFKEEVKKYFAHYRCAINTYEAIINHIFGRPNLTSDAEGEEALMCDRNTVRMLYDRTDSVKVRQTLESLFGSKCLSDDTKEPKPAEPKKESRNLSQETANCDKQFDNILKDSFRNERRLNIAAMAMQGIVSNPTAMNGPKLIDGDEEILAKWSLKFADALIAECERSEKLKEN